MSLEYQSKLNRLLVIGKKNGLFFSEWLRKNGYSDQLIRRYRQSGWLATLDKGVMYRTGDTLSSFAALSCYNEQLNKKVRVAAHSALEVAFVRIFGILSDNKEFIKIVNCSQFWLVTR